MTRGFSFLRAIPHSYATILFSDNLWLGLILMLLTMLSPIVGLSGLAGLVIALLANRAVGFEGWDSGSGINSFNSLLIALAIGYYYPLSGIASQPEQYAALLLVASLSTLFLYAVLTHFTLSWFKLPSMSLAFSIAATVFWYYLVRSGDFTGTGFAKPIILSAKPDLIWFWRDYLLSMGSIVFVPDILAGIAVTLILLIISRIAFMLSLMGWGICYFLLSFVNIGSTYGMFFPGFNLILISLTIGSVFLIPSKSAYLTAAIATVIGFALAFVLSGKYYFPDYMPARGDVLLIPIFAFPLNIVVLIVIFALRLRALPRSPIINDLGILHPEKALDAYLSRYKRFSSTGIPQMQLPVTGEWLVTQGHNGTHTHKKEWAFAWDFEIEDRFGKKYSDVPDSVKDYYAFGKNVYAAAAGYVVKVVNKIPDNPIGITNTQDNWGNYVTISHGYGFYSLYAHLKEGSVKLAEGDYIKQGEKLGLVGNSGRSPIPHLHFQAQSGIDAGTKSIFCHIVNYKYLDEIGDYTFITSGIPKEGDIISPLVAERELANILHLSYDQSQSYHVQTNGRKFVENWKVELDLMGIHRIHSDSGAKLEYSIYNGIFNALNLTKLKPGALRAFALASSRIPWIENHNLNWTDEPSLSVTMSPFWKNVTLFLIPFFKPIRVRTLSRIVVEKKDILLVSTTDLSVLGMTIKKYLAKVTITRKNGIREISLHRGDQELVTATRIQPEEESNE
ncbi:MAG: urea transporter [Candidatus Cloacimonadaceae bacterium]|nr:urea transporter [Candidatus Cloacimonadaceae bacterium]